jgi:hypothetical protein
MPLRAFRGGNPLECIVAFSDKWPSGRAWLVAKLGELNSRFNEMNQALTRDEEVYFPCGGSGPPRRALKTCMRRGGVMLGTVCQGLGVDR